MGTNAIDYWQKQYQASHAQVLAQIAAAQAQSRGMMGMGAPLGMQPGGGLASLMQPGVQAAQSGGSQAAPQGTPDTVSRALEANPELMGRAQFWGIPQGVASAMPQDQLEELLQQHEAQARSAQADGSWYGQMGAHLGAVAAMFGTGAAQAILEAPRNIPIVGEYYRRFQAAQNGIAALSDLQEGVRASTQSDFQWVNSMASGAGGLAAMWYPAASVWKAAAVVGKAFGALGVASPILQGAAQGAAASYLMEGGGEHPIAGMAVGTVLGAASHPVEEALKRFAPDIAAGADRISRYFTGDWAKAVGPLGENISGAAPAVGDQVAQAAAAPQDAVAKLQQMASDPTATDETRQQAADMLRYMNQRLEPIDPGSMAASLNRRTAATPSESFGDPMQGPQPRLSLDPEVVAPPEVTVSHALRFLNGTITPGEDPWAAAFRASNIGLNPAEGEAGHLTNRGRFVSPEEAVSLNAPRPSPDAINVENAGQAADQMSKQSLIVESPALWKAAGQVAPNDGTVAAAVTSMNPGGINVVPAVSSPAEFLQLAGMNPNGMGEVRFARRAGSTALDAIMSETPITDRMVAQYEQHGVFEGQTALKPNGRQVLVKSIGEDGNATVRSIYGGVDHQVAAKDLMPSATSAVATPVPGMYDEFHNYVTGRVQATADAMGGALLPERLAQLRADNMPGYLEDFLDEAKIEAPGERARVRQYFNERLVDDYSKSVPEESAFQDSMEQQSAQVEAATQPLQTPMRRVGAMAQAKGYTLIPIGETGQWKLVDAVGSPAGGAPRAPMAMTFSDLDAAQETLQRLNRTLPEVQPAVSGGVPMDVARALPTESLAPPALPNELLHEATAASADDIANTVAEEDPGLAEHLRGVIADARASGGIHRIQEAWDYAMSSFQPMRTRYAEIDQRLVKSGLGAIRLAEDQNNLTVASQRMNEWARPWKNQIEEILRPFKAEQLRDGTVFRTYQIEDSVARLAAAQKAGMGPEEIDALERMNGFAKDIFPETGLDPMREIARYISHVGPRQALGAGVADAYEGFQGMSGPVRPFYEMARAGQMPLMEVDPRNVMNTYVRAIGFKKFMEEEWNAQTTKWNAIGQIPELKDLATTYTNWANLLKTGYVPGSDAVLDTMHGAMSMIMPGISKAQVRKIFAQGMSDTHMALLGFRPDILARDSMRLFLALPRVGTDLIGVMKDIATQSREDAAAMFQRGLDGGYVISGRPQVAVPGAFEPTMQYTGDAPVGNPDMPMAQGFEGMNMQAQDRTPRGPVFRLGQVLGDAIDQLPKSVTSLEEGKLNPLYLFSKQSEMMRLAVGEAGLRRATRAITAFRSAGDAGDMDTLMGDSMARTFYPWVQQKFRDLIASGSDTEAAQFMARQVTDATMFRYGTTDNMEFGRTTGGKMVTQFGNFAPQMYQYMKESLQYGNWQDKAKFLAMMGGTTMALRAAQQATGWDFSRYMFHNSLGFTGGPWVQGVLQSQKLATDISQMIKGDQTPLGTSGAYAGKDASGIMKDIGGVGFDMINPAEGITNLAGGMINASQSVNPANAFGRLFFTGEHSNVSDVSDMLKNSYGPAVAQQAVPVPPMQPYQSPVSGTRSGVPVPPMAAAFQSMPGFQVKNYTGLPGVFPRPTSSGAQQ